MAVVAVGIQSSPLVQLRLRLLSSWIAQLPSQTPTRWFPPLCLAGFFLRRAHSARALSLPKPSVLVFRPGVFVLSDTVFATDTKKATQTCNSLLNQILTSKTTQWSGSKSGFELNVTILINLRRSPTIIMKYYPDRQPHSISCTHVSGDFGRPVPHSRQLNPLPSPAPLAALPQPVRLLVPADIFPKTSPPIVVTKFRIPK
jgi:hypothetical protein